MACLLQHSSDANLQKCAASMWARFHIQHIRAKRKSFLNLSAPLLLALEQASTGDVAQCPRPQLVGQKCAAAVELVQALPWNSNPKRRHRKVISSSR